MTWLWVGLGSAIGGMARYGVGLVVRSFAVVGICGGFTTSSIFSNDVFRMLGNGQGLRTHLYISLSLVGGLTAVLLGYWISR